MRFGPFKSNQLQVEFAVCKSRCHYSDTHVCATQTVGSTQPLCPSIGRSSSLWDMKGGKNPERWTTDQWIGTRYNWDGKRALWLSQACVETLTLPALCCGLKGHPLSHRQLFGDKSREALSHSNWSAGSHPAVCWPVWECHGGPSPSPNKPNPHTEWLLGSLPLRPSPNHSHTSKKNSFRPVYTKQHNHH